MSNEISSAELAEAFAGKKAAKKVAKKEAKKSASKAASKAKPLTKKKKVLSICLLVVGLAVLATGVVFLALNILKSNRAADGEYLVSAGEWVLEGEDGVVWDFTEIGQGSLTTNNHLNDYNFKWAIEDEKLLIETEWLYDLENEYTYELDQGAGTLTLTDSDGKTYEFTKQ